jgi:hypothetical protein
MGVTRPAPPMRVRRRAGEPLDSRDELGCSGSPPPATGTGCEAASPRVADLPSRSRSRTNEEPVDCPELIIECKCNCGPLRWGFPAHEAEGEGDPPAPLRSFHEEVLEADGRRRSSRPSVRWCSPPFHFVRLRERGRRGSACRGCIRPRPGPRDAARESGLASVAARCLAVRMAMSRA